MNKDFSLQCLRNSKVYETKQEAIEELNSVQSSDGSIVLARYKDSTGKIKTLIATNCNLDGISDPDLKSANYTIYDPEPYTLPTASSDTLGGIKIGEGLSIDESGAVSASGGGVGKVDPNSDGTGEIFNNYSGNYINKATGNYSHAEGERTSASGIGSHAEGVVTTASGDYSHAEGTSTTASGDYSHAEGGITTARGDYSHAEGCGTTTKNAHEHAQGTFNKSNTGTNSTKQTIHSIGIGTSSSDQKNAVEVMKNGDVYINGIGGYDGTNYSSAKTLQESIPEPYTLPTASSSTLGGVKVGAGLRIDSGVLSATGGGTADAVAWENVTGKPDDIVNITTKLSGKADKSTTLSGYGITDGVNAVSVTGSGNAVTTASVSGHTLTLNKGTSFAASSHTHTGSDITGLTASMALTSDANGHVTVSAVTATELGYLDGVTSSIQTQLNGKAASSHTHTVSQITDIDATYAKKNRHTC